MCDNKLPRDRATPTEMRSVVVGRFDRLMAAIDLTPVSKNHFRTMCQLLEGTATEQIIDGKSALLAKISEELETHKEFLSEVAHQKFADDTPQSRNAFRRELGGAAKRLLEVMNVVDRLDEIQSFALLEHIEEVLHGVSDREIEDRCALVYKKMQAPLNI